MPRRHRAARDRTDLPVRPSRPTSDPPAWAQAAGFEVRTVSGEKAYRCPGCDHEIHPPATHLVVVPARDPGERRHWHTECWRRELRRTRR
jgi:hypothetical protein